MEDEIVELSFRRSLKFSSLKESFLKTATLPNLEKWLSVINNNCTLWALAERKEQITGEDIANEINNRQLQKDTI